MVTNNPFEPKDETNTSALDLNEITAENVTANRTGDESIGSFEPLEQDESFDSDELVQPEELKLDDLKNTQSEIEPIDDTPSFASRAKRWLWRHRWLFIILALVLIAAIICVIVDRNLNRVELNVSSSGLRVTLDKNANGQEVDTELAIRVLAYNADIGSGDELLYALDTTATAKTDGTMNIKWDIPREQAYMRATYNEFCVLDEARANEEVNNHCSGYPDVTTLQESILAGVTNLTDSSSIDSTAKFNKISCAYYIPAHTNGLVAFLSGWNRLDDNQLVGCAGSALKNGTVFGDESYMKPVDEPEETTGLVVNNSYYSSSSYSNSQNNTHSTYNLDLSPTGVIAGTYCGSGDYAETIDRPATVSGSDNSTTINYTCIPIFTVGSDGRITNVTSKTISYDATVGNEIVGVTGSNSGLTRSGEGTFLDPYTLAVSINSGSLKIANNQIAVLAPACSNNEDKLQWVQDGDYGYFICGLDIDTNTNDQRLSITNQAVTNGTSYTISLTGDTSTNVSFTDIDTNTNSQELTATSTDATANNVTTTTTIVQLSGDSPSSIQFTSKDTVYTASSGITIDSTNHTIGINSPTCSGNTQALTWTGSSFQCVSGTDFTISANNATGQQISDNGNINFNNGTGLTANRSDNSISYSLNNTTVTAGAYNASQGTTTNGVTITVPSFTVNAQGQLTSASTSTVASITGGVGVSISNAGVISLPGLTNNGNVAGGTCATGSGLSWNGSRFICTTAYSWNLSANDATSPIAINSDGTVVFRAGSGLTASRDGNNIVYTVKLGDGLVFDTNNGIALMSCSVGQILKVNSEGKWACASDNDTLVDVDGKCIATDIVRNLSVSRDLGSYGADLTPQGATKTGYQKEIVATVTASSGFTMGRIASIHAEFLWGYNNVDNDPTLDPNGTASSSPWPALSTYNRYLGAVRTDIDCNFEPASSTILNAVVYINNPTNGGGGISYTGSAIGMLTEPGTETWGGVDYHIDSYIRFDEWIDAIFINQADKNPINDGDRIIVDIMYINNS